MELLVRAGNIIGKKPCTVQPRLNVCVSSNLKPENFGIGNCRFVSLSTSRDLIFGLSWHLEGKVWGLWVCAESHGFASVVLLIPAEQLAQWLLILFSEPWIGLEKFESVSNGYFADVKYESVSLFWLVS